MFKGMRKLITDKSVKGNPASQLGSDFMPMRTAEQLLSHPKRKKILAEIYPLISLSHESTERLCKQLIANFAEFTQELPQTRHNFYNHVGGMIDHALERSHIAMKLVRAYFLPTGSADASLSQPQSLWAYALFSASILRDIGRLVVDLTVKTYPQKASEGMIWRPFEASLLSQGKFYRYQFHEDYPESFRRNATVLLAQQIMPEAGYRWITSNRDVFMVWLALLQDDEQHYGILGAVLERAEAQAMLQHLREIGYPIEGFEVNPQDNSRAADEQLEDSVVKGEGLEFINWLRQEITRQASLREKAIPGGFLIDDELIKLFARYLSNDKFITVTEDSIKSTLIKQGIIKESTRSYMNTKTKSIISGLVLQNAELILQGQNNAIRYQAAENAKQYLAIGSLPAGREQYIALNGDILNSKPVEADPSYRPSPTQPFTG